MSNAHWHALPDALRENAAAVIACRIIEEIVCDFNNGNVPQRVASFAEVHAHVDGNMYAFDFVSMLLGTEAITDERTDLMNAASAIVDAYLVEIARQRTETVYFAEHDHIEFPKALRDLGAKDESWHNDTAARAFIPLAQPQGTAIVNETAGVWVWVAEREPRDREFPDMPRFAAYLATYETSADNSATFIETEDLDECVVAIAGVLAAERQARGL